MTSNLIDTCGICNKGLVHTQMPSIILAGARLVAYS